MTSDTALRTRWFFGIVSAQLALVILLAVFHESALFAGVRIRLKVVPIDPRSLFMGQYLALRYEAETIDLNHVALKGFDHKNIKGGQIVVILREEGGIAQPVAVQPPPCPAKIPSNHFCLTATRIFSEGNILRVDYHLDRYYVSEANATEAERRLQEAWAKNEEVVAEIALDRRGRGQIVRLLVGGRPFPF